MADSTYEAEVQALQSFLGMQHPVVSPGLNSSVNSNPNQLEIQPEDFVAARFFKKIKSKSVNLIKKFFDIFRTRTPKTLFPTLMEPCFDH